MASIYDRADIYDLIEDEKRFSFNQRHWQIVLEGKEIHSLLDVSIGSGSLTLPLAELGVELFGSDLSASMLTRCEKKAAARGVPITLKQADFRKVSTCFDRQFDCVASTGNSLPHVSNADALQALAEMGRLVKPGGWLYFDLRNWDKILRERQRFYLYNPFFDGDTRVNLVQVWDYHDDGTMTSTLEKDDTLPAPDPKILKVIEKENKKFEPILKQTVGEALVDLCERDPATGERRVRSQETNMGDFVADAFRAVLNTDIALVNGGSLRNKISKGVFTYQDILTAFPFGNMSSAVEVTGQTILDALELGSMNTPDENGGFLQASGLTYTIEATIPSTVELDAHGSFVAVRGDRRIRDVMIGGKPLDPEKIYTVGGTTYVLKDGGNGMVMFKGAKLIDDGTLTDADMIMEYVQNHMNAKIGEEYANWQGQGRITIIK